MWFPRESEAQVLPPENIYQRLLPSVMTLRVENVQGEVYVGTGFLALDKNIAVTAWHVVSDATNVTAKFSDGRIVNVTGLIDRDEAHDLALIRLDGGDGPQAAVSTPSPLVGSRAYVIGAPKGFDFSMTDGLVSQIQKINGDDQYQVSCPISGGNSGGPVLNDRGQVIGIVAWTKKDAQNLSFAIPAAWLAHLRAGLSPVPWKTINQIAPANMKNLIPANSANVSEPQESLSALKRLLKADTGRQLTITVSEGDTEKSFNFVVPKDFVK